MKTLIAFRYGDTRIFSRIVCWVRGGDSAHCEAAQNIWGSQYACVSASFLDGGVRGKVMSLPASKWRIYEVPAAVSPFEWLGAHAGSRYDWLGLLGLVVAALKHRRGSWFCSEACADMLGLEGSDRYDLVRLEEYCARVGKRIQCP